MAAIEEKTYPELERAISPNHDIKLFAGRSNPALAQEIANELGTSIGPMVVKNFSDGEIYVQVKESVRGDDVFIIQPICNPVNENLMELLIIIDAFKRASAKSITAVMQDRTEKLQAEKPLQQNLLQICLQPQEQTGFLQWIYTQVKFRDFSIF